MRTEQVTVDGVSFQLMPMPLMEARKWDAKILMILVPLLGALDALEEATEGAKPATEPRAPTELPEGFDPFEGGLPEDTEEKSADNTGIKDFGKIAISLQGALSALPDEVMDALVRGMFARVTCIPLDGAPFVLNAPKYIDQAFEDCGPLAIYKLLFEVARFNKFTPFALAGAGAATAGILASLVPAKVRKGLSMGRLAG